MEFARLLESIAEQTRGPDRDAAIDGLREFIAANTSPTRQLHD